MEDKLQELLELLHADLVSKFAELKCDNNSLKQRLQLIEEKLGIQTQSENVLNEVVAVKEAENKKCDTIEPVSTNNDELKETDVMENNNEEQEEEHEQEYEDDNFSEEEILLEEEIIKDETSHTREEVKLEELPTSTYLGYCFRPLAGWRNSQGRREISREWVTLSQDQIELKICGFESGEEIAKISIPLKDIEKVEASFDERTVLFLFVVKDICDAAVQSLSMTNISSFSLVDLDENKIRFSVTTKCLLNKTKSLLDAIIKSFCNVLDKMPKCLKCSMC